MKNIFSLSNKYIFWIIIFLMTSILVGVNNYFFYSHVERSAGKDIQQLDDMLQAFYKNCKTRNTSIETCNNNLILLIKAFSTKAHYNGDIKIKGVWEKPKFDNWDSTAKSNVEIILPADYEKNVLEVNKSTYFSNYLFFITIFKSMTFSITDIINDIFQKIYAKEDGIFKVVPNGKYVDYKIDDNNVKSIRKHTIAVGDGQSVKKGDLLAYGNIHVAIDKFSRSYWYRSRPMICFAVFAYFLILIFRKREQRIEIEQRKIDEDILTEIKEGTKDLSLNLEELIDKFRKNDNIINPPCNFVEYEKMFESDIDVLGTRFRKVLEKIVFDLYKKYIKSDDSTVTLNDAIRELSNKRIISKVVANNLHAVRVFGNSSAHYNEGQKISKIEIVSVANSLICAVEELIENLENNKKC